MLSWKLKPRHCPRGKLALGKIGLVGIAIARSASLSLILGRTLREGIIVAATKPSMKIEKSSVIPIRDVVKFILLNIPIQRGSMQFYAVHLVRGLSSPESDKVAF